MSQKNNNKWLTMTNRLIMLATCCLMLMAVVVQRDGRLFGHELTAQTQTADSVVTYRPDGSVIINTTTIASDIIGYGGPIPMEITLAGGKVADIKVLRCAETPSFLNSVLPILDKWKGLTPSEVMKAEVDAVSGATYTSTAIIAVVGRAMEYAVNSGVAPRSFWHDIDQWLSPAFIVSLIVVLMACIVPLFTKNKWYRLAQLVLNVTILGFWTGTFINYTMLLRFFANGINVVSSFIIVLMMIAAFIYPLFGKTNHYCMWICPLGSIQELAGRAVPYKVKMTGRVIKWLTYFRYLLWSALMLIMWCGIYFSWVDYELFSAFLFHEAALPVVIAAIVIVALSTIVNRPYCRFICPTGMLFKIDN